MKGWRPAIIKAALTAVCVVVLGLIQAGFFDRLKVLNCKPELVLCFVIVLSTRLEGLRAGLTGFFAGLYLDIVYGRYIGVYAVLYLVFCAVTSVAAFRASEKHKWVGAAVLPPVFLLYEIAESLLVRIIAVYVAGGGPLYHYGYGRHFAVRILPGAAYNLAAGLAMFLVLLLVRRIMRPRPGIRYRKERNVVIDHA